MNWIYRQLLKLGNWLFETYCYLRQPVRRGAYVVVWWGNRVLLVKNSYKTELTFPSGGVGSRETPLAGARRELEEEVGLVAGSEDFTFLAEMSIYHDNIHDRVFAFELAYENEPPIRIDNREVTGVRFEEIDQALRLDLGVVAQSILRSYVRSPNGRFRPTLHGGDFYRKALREYSS